MVLLDFEEFPMHVPNWTEVNQFCRFTIFYIVVPPSTACAQVDGFTKRGRVFAFASFVESETHPDNVPVGSYRLEVPNSCSIRTNRIKHLEMERHWMLVNEFHSSSVFSRLLRQRFSLLRRPWNAFHRECWPQPISMRVTHGTKAKDRLTLGVFGRCAWDF